MSFFSRSGCLVAVAGVVAVVSACTHGDKPCTPESEGYGDAAALGWTSLLEADRTEGACRPRVEILSNGADLRRATDELQLDEAPFVDFAREKVVVREAPVDRGVTWMAARGDKVTIGTQGCSGTEPTGCHVHFYKVTTNGGASVDEHACPALSCGAVQSDPSGGGL